MEIRIEVKNEILGDSVFWKGKSDCIHQIRNIPAQIAAKRLIKTGQTAKFGMWIAFEIKGGE